MKIFSTFTFIHTLINFLCFGVNYSVVGAVLIVCGLYMVLWGKSKEMNKTLQLTPSESVAQLELKDVVVTTPKPSK